MNMENYNGSTFHNELEECIMEMDMRKNRFESASSSAKEAYEKACAEADKEFKEKERLLIEKYVRRVKPLEREYYKVERCARRALSEKSRRINDLREKDLEYADEYFKNKIEFILSHQKYSYLRDSIYIMRKRRMNEIQKKYNDKISRVKKEYDDKVKPYLDRYESAKEEIDREFSNIKQDRDMKVNMAREQYDLTVKEAIDEYNKGAISDEPLLSKLVNRNVQKVKKLLKLK